MSILPRVGVTVVFVVTGCLPAAAIACGHFGADQDAVDKVQSSWGPAETAAGRSDYAKALKLLDGTRPYVSSIHDANTRRCVGEGADIRISSARAGEAYIAAHPGDKDGAKAAYNKAWTAFPLQGNCP